MSSEGFVLIIKKTKTDKIMKFGFISGAAVMALTMMACNGNGIKGNGDSVDSVANTEECASQVVDVAKANGYSDLAVFELKGRVKSCVKEYEESKETFLFDENGKVLSISLPYENVGEIERDAEGRIWRINKTDEIGRGYADEFAYDEKGRIVKASCDAMPDGLAYSYDYQYDEKGRVTFISGFDDGPGKMEIRYEYYGEDKAGNWTKRKRSYLVEGESEPYDMIEERTIEYY